jgi:hypothetical protein
VLNESEPAALDAESAALLAKAYALVNPRAPKKVRDIVRTMTLFLQQAVFAGEKRDRLLSLSGSNAVVMLDALQVVSTASAITWATTEIRATVHSGWTSTAAIDCGAQSFDCSSSSRPRANACRPRWTSTESTCRTATRFAAAGSLTFTLVDIANRK